MNSGVLSGFEIPFPIEKTIPIILDFLPPNIPGNEYLYRCIGLEMAVEFPQALCCYPAEIPHISQRREGIRFSDTHLFNTPLLSVCHFFVEERLDIGFQSVLLLV